MIKSREGLDNDERKPREGQATIERKSIQHHETVKRKARGSQVKVKIESQEEVERKSRESHLMGPGIVPSVQLVVRCRFQMNRSTGARPVEHA